MKILLLSVIGCNDYRTEGDSVPQMNEDIIPSKIE
jgi:hypothetical protein